MTEIAQADRELFITILNPDSSTAESVRQGMSYTWEVEQIARHREQARMEERAAIVAWLRQSPQFINSHGIADAIEAGEHLK